jgi:hypothetical protein
LFGGAAGGTIRRMHRSLVTVAVLSCWLACVAAGPSTAPASRPSTHPIAQSADGSILLHARDVTIHGDTVRYEPKPEKNTIGFWTKKEDWVSWDFQVPRPGRFHVVILQGCGKGSGGAEVTFAIDDAQTLSHTVEVTGGFQNFVERDLGTIELNEGRHTLSVKPRTKPGRAVMDLRQVLLKPVE